MSPRVVVDTNVVVSALIWGGTPGRVLEAVLSGEAQLLISEDIVSEIRRVLGSYKFRSYFENSGIAISQVVDDLISVAETVEPAEVSRDIVRDPKDAMIVACAIGGGADLIVSGDKDLTSANVIDSIRVVTPQVFLSILIAFGDNPNET